MRVAVLRLGHRPERDKRITTHVGLVARAFGAEEMLLAGRDEKLVAGLEDVAERWGGDFRVRSVLSWRGEARRWKDVGGKIVHLTMYGTPLSEAIGEIRLSEAVMVVVGAEKVPPEIYEMADWNVGVGNQPHSEVAALAVFLDRLWGGEELNREFEGRIEVVPSPRYKTVIERREDEG
ncbi:MAG: tRNA (cytidine(56)-2'-O)-methyltransferase [Methanothrix sp.]|jgi:tRNA (cytidine56-2'-O)-methyltransferase|nr:MAG: tRNA 2'-O-methylase [Methanosaeta sp. SDB]MCP1391777.1 tRNA (cytidine(56)-2'-O)-methyltransferase [Methanothrix harundinacea]MDD3709730.1 tRNA (cytidine(56)-2'-O)-methyltransferase [Methanothrix sp.]MDD5769014.1 tRNA (cytidine(56)-2'-O)-methyltransferase [Methanothrix sp.]MDI9397975.1 tRNA (cytidine(56)-2'-O)-methyltransferase [Euryarchaeota archaeon]